MGKVNQLAQDERDRQVEQYLADHPGSDEEMAHEALFGREDNAPDEPPQDLTKYVPEDLPEHLRWKGEGPPPAYWYVGSTKVYRSYADYCDD